MLDNTLLLRIAECLPRSHASNNVPVMLLGKLGGLVKTGGVLSLSGANNKQLMATVLRAFGQEVDLVDVIIINEAVAFFAGVVPVPGGIGVTEAALTAGFVAVGVPDDIAFSAALCYRLCTFYLPPIWGYGSLQWLTRKGYV